MSFSQLLIKTNWGKMRMTSEDPKMIRVLSRLGLLYYNTHSDKQKRGEHVGGTQLLWDRKGQKIGTTMLRNS